MAVDTKVIEEKVKSGKIDSLTKEEAEVILREDVEPVEGYTKNDVQDMTPAEFDNEPEGDKAKEEKPKEEAKPAEAAKQAEPAQDDRKVDMVKLEAEFAKPEGQEDIKNFTDREKAYFHQMRRDRKRAQKAEAEADAARFREQKLKQELDAAKKPAPKPEDDPIELLKKRDPTDYLTVAEVIKVVEGISKKPADQAQAEAKDEPKGGRPAQDPVRLRYLTMCEKEARDTHPEDFDVTMELIDDVINNNPKHLKEVAESMQRGENPALKAYELIKADPEYAKLAPVAKTKIEARKGAVETPAKKEEEKPQKSAAELEKEKKAIAAQEAMEKNKTKPKTTGHVETTGANGDEISFDDIAKMSDREFAKLPKKTRERYLRAMEEV